MKKILILSFLLIFLISCSTTENSKVKITEKKLESDKNKVIEEVITYKINETEKNEMNSEKVV